MEFKKINNLYKAHTAVVLRLVEEYKDSLRIIIINSAFASVMTALALRKIGLHCTGMVKHCTFSYPVKSMKQFDEETKATRGLGLAMKVVKSSYSM